MEHKDIVKDDRRSVSEDESCQVSVKQSMYESIRLQEVRASRIAMQSTHENDNVFNLRTGRLYLPGDVPGTHFCYRLSRP